MPIFSHILRATCIGFVFLLAACSPKFDWREVRGAGAPYMVMLPSKPASHTRDINLDGIALSMTMTAAEVDGVTFAVGAGALRDPSQAPAALETMKSALVRNIEGTLKQERRLAADGSPAAIEIEASGPPPRKGGEPRLLLARFVAKGKYIYQVVVVGSEKAVSREAAETFFASFKPD